MQAHDRSSRAARLLPAYSQREEIAHAVTHAIGFVASLIGSIVLVSTALSHGGTRHIVGAAVFGTSLILVYAASTLYHGSREPAKKLFFQRLDHIAIYLLIAGTYTPITLILMRDQNGAKLLSAIWALAMLGISLEFSRTREGRGISLALYLAMGWLAVLAGEPLLRALDPNGIALLVLGGLLYTSGIVFYAWERLPYNHAIWHGFVLAGSALHFSCVLRFVNP